VAAAWIRGHRGASKRELERRLGAVEASGQEPLSRGVAFDLAIARGTHTFDDVGRSLQAARRAVELASPESSEEYFVAATTLGRMLYLAGQTTEAQGVLEEGARRLPPADQQPHQLVNVLALLSLLAGEQGDDATAATFARQAMDAAEAQGVSLIPMNGIAYLALARAAARRGGLAEAEQLLEQALSILEIDSFQAQYTQALLELAGVRNARGDPEGAEEALKRARDLISQFVDPGMLPPLLDSTERALHRAARGRALPTGALTDRELAVLRLLPTRLTQQEIAQELYVSVNTVRTHIQGIYRKLGVASRQEAITHARELGLLPLRIGAAGAGGPA